jgi:MFS family permease
MHPQRRAPSAPIGNSSFEWWYMAQFSVGAIHSGFMPILIPTYVISVTGTATDVGIVMGIMGLAAMVAAPVIGSLADKYGAYRTAQLSALASQALAALIFALSGDMLLFCVGTVFLGVGTATLMMINPTFVLGADLPREVESLRLTRLSQTGRVGSLLGALAVAGVIHASLSFPLRFAIMSGVAAGCLLITAIANRDAAARIKGASREVGEEASAAKVPLRKVLVSTFGLLLLGGLCATVGLEVMYGQYPNYMYDVFRISPALCAAAVSVSALLTLLVLDLGGRWMGGSGPAPVWLTSLGVRLVAVGLLIPLACLPPVSVLLPLGAYVLLRLSQAWFLLTLPPLARGMSKGAVGSTQGIVITATAIGFIIANMLSGWSADAFGFKSLPWLAAVITALALLLGYLAIIRSRSEQPEKVRV